MKTFAFAAALLCLTLSGCAVYVPAQPRATFAYGVPSYPHAYYWR